MKDCTTRAATCATAIITRSEDTAQKKAVDNALRDFELVRHRPAERRAQQRYGEIATRLSELGSQYSNTALLDAAMGWTKLITDEAELAGMPGALAAAKARG